MLDYNINLVFIDMVKCDCMIYRMVKGMEMVNIEDSMCNDDIGVSGVGE